MNRYKKKLLAFLIIGITPERLALCIALGIAFGLVPALGTTTLLCALAAFLFRLNLAAIQLINFAVYPLQIALLIPFMQAGARLFGNEPIQLSFEEIQGMLETGLWVTVTGLWVTTLQAVVVWILIAPLIIGLVFVLLTPVLRKMNIERKIAAS
ncbi:MAG: DUF2062 domain-containing protein [Acidobacteria bacterium]|nr:DUF2062 domain-containing protein [Acidobacteriota bacterium]